MDECSNKTTDDLVGEEVLQSGVSQDESVATLFLSGPFSSMVMHVLVESGCSHDVLIVVHGPEGDGLGLESGINLYSEMEVLDKQRLIPLQQFMNLDVKEEMLLPRIMEELPYWKQVNYHPQGPGRNQRKGGKHLSEQKRKR